MLKLSCFSSWIFLFFKLVWLKEHVQWNQLHAQFKVYYLWRIYVQLKVIVSELRELFFFIFHEATRHFIGWHSSRKASSNGFPTGYHEDSFLLGTRNSIFPHTLILLLLSLLTSSDSAFATSRKRPTFVACFRVICVLFGRKHPSFDMCSDWSDLSLVRM